MTSSTGSLGCASNAPNMPIGTHASIADASGRARYAFAIVAPMLCETMASLVMPLSRR
jgi:hypothetical protein